MRKIIFVLMLFILAVFVTAENPPTLDSHQFYGKVSWDKNLTAAPQSVTAKIGTTEFKSSIKSPVCSGTVCSGEYGKDATNILRVSGKNGDKIDFYVLGKLYGSKTYQSDAVEEYNLNFAKEDVTIPEGCEDDWVDCASWSSCVSGKQNRTCKNECDKTIESDEERSCTAGTSTTSTSTTSGSTKTNTCTYLWSCTTWNSCSNNQQFRTCSRTDDCDKKLADKQVSSVIKVSRPEEFKSCLVLTAVAEGTYTPPVFEEETETCFDGIQNQNEEGIDCGGSCRACKETKAAGGISLILYIVGFTLVFLIGVIALVYYLRKKGTLDVGVSLELRNAYDNGEDRGMTPDQVTKALLDKGWDESVLKKFLKNR